VLNVIVVQSLREVAQRLHNGHPGTIVLLQKDDYTGEGSWCNLFGPAEVLEEIKPRVADRQPLEPRVGRRPKSFAALSVLGTAQEIERVLVA
jgi:hypothetical protein